MNSQRQPFLIVVHDVAPPFLQNLQTIFHTLQPLVGSRYSCAVVPRWHGAPLMPEDALLESISTCGELLLHGHTHFRQHLPGLVSLLTGRSDEFGALSHAEIQDRVSTAQHDLERLTGRTISGLVPPAWHMPMAATLLENLSYVMRFSRLESCQTDGNIQPLATWSFDWGWVKPAAAAADMFSTARLKLIKNAIPCVAIHPVDVSRGWMPRITALVQELLDQGRTPALPNEITLQLKAT